MVIHAMNLNEMTKRTGVDGFFFNTKTQTWDISTFRPQTDDEESVKETKKEKPVI